MVESEAKELSEEIMLGAVVSFEAMRLIHPETVAGETWRGLTTITGAWIGGGANQEQIENAFGILLSDPNVRAIFINIFGGILRVDVLAAAVVAAAKKLNVKVPIILRLEGTNVEEGRKILADSGLKFQVGETMKEAADLAVAAARA